MARPSFTVEQARDKGCWREQQSPPEPRLKHSSSGSNCGCGCQEWVWGTESAAAGRPQCAKVVVSNDSCRGGVGPPSSSPGLWTPAPAQLLFLAFPVSVLCPDCNYIYQSSLCRVANQCFVCFCTEMYLSTSGKLTFSFHSVKRTFQTAGWAHHQTP